MALKRRSIFYLPLTILAFAVAGGLYGPKTQAAAASPEGVDPESGVVRKVTQVYALVEQNSANRVSPDKAIYDGAIPGMLRTLDPHSNFFDPKQYQLLREEQKGHYYGVGMQVGARNGQTVVSAPFPGTPAYRAGLRPGDIITKVNDKPTGGLSTTEVADLLKGPKGTQVTITVAREGAPDPLSFTVTREEIDRPTVAPVFWVKPGIAYIKISSFGDNTGRELDDAFRRLGEANIKGLVLDLRANPGGLLNRGVEVADHFLQKNQLIVSHHGRASAEQAYVARTGNHGRDYPIVVLVNRLSASAAEIVSGALQDHDRAWILGERTFGKGLVQTVYPLSDNTGLALTTAHYYTPSGRLIQRDYSNRSFLDYYYGRHDDAPNSNDVKMTDSGRTVYGGDGITPDEKFATATLDRLEVELERRALFGFTRSYFATHSTALAKGWMPDEGTVDELHEYLLKNGVSFTEAEFTADHDWIVRNLAREMYIAAFNVDQADQMYAQTDPEVQRAVDALPKATALVENARKIIVQRMNSQPAAGSAARR